MPDTSEKAGGVSGLLAWPDTSEKAGGEGVGQEKKGDGGAREGGERGAGEVWEGRWGGERRVWKGRERGGRDRRARKGDIWARKGRGGGGGGGGCGNGLLKLGDTPGLGSDPSHYPSPPNNNFNDL